MRNAGSRHPRRGYVVFRGQLGQRDVVTVVLVRDVEEGGSSPGQQVRPAVVVVVRAIGLRQGARLPVVSRHAHEAPGATGEEDRSVFAPASTPELRRLGEGHDRTTVDRDPLELAIRPEAEGAAVRGEEGTDRSFGIGKGPRVQLAAVPHVEEADALLAAHERNPLAVRRDGEARRSVVGIRDDHTSRQSELEPGLANRTGHRPVARPVAQEAGEGTDPDNQGGDDRRPSCLGRRPCQGFPRDGEGRARC